MNLIGREPSTPSISMRRMPIQEIIRQTW